MSGRHGRGRAGGGEPAAENGRPPGSSGRPSPPFRATTGAARVAGPGRTPGGGRRPTTPGGGSRPEPVRPPAPRSPGVTVGSRAIFRKEALEFHARGKDTEGAVVRLGAAWIRWCYRATIAIVAAGVAAVALTQVKQASDGSAVINPASGRFAALFPAATVQALPEAKGLGFVLPEGGLRRFHVAGMRVTLATAKAVTRAGLAAPRQPSILLTGRLVGPVAPAAGRLHAGAVVILPTTSLAAVLGQEVRAMLGKSGTRS